MKKNLFIKKEIMTSHSNLYDTERIQKIGEIMPGLCNYAEKGDEIALGLVGDPEFPEAYRGSRPTGIIEDIKKENDATIISARMEDGQLMNLPSTTIGAYNTWEFTDSGFNKVLKREEEKAARSESSISSPVPDYRGANTGDLSNIEERLKNIEQTLRKFEMTQSTFRSTVVSTFKEVANDVNRLSESQGLNTKFCGSLVGRYEDLMKSRSESKFRGSKEYEDEDEEEYRGSEDDEELNSSVISSEQSRNEKLNFSDDDASLISDEED
jgi:hypothetical protein